MDRIFFKSVKAETKNMSELIFAVKPVIYLEYFYCMIRFQIVGEELKKIGKKTKLVVFLVSAIWSTVYIFVLVKYFMLAKKGYLDTVADVLDKLPLILVMFDYIIYINITSLLHGGHNIRLFRSMNQIDHCLNIKGNKKWYKKNRMLCIRIIVGLLVYYVVSTAIASIVFGNLDLTIELVLSFFGFLIDFEFCFFCIMIHMTELRLNILNDHLSNIVKRNTKNTFHVFTITNRKLSICDTMMVKRMNLIDLASMYELIGEMYSSINKVFGFHIAMIMIIDFTYMIISIWISVYYYKSSKETFLAASVIMTWSVTGLVGLALMCYVCSKVLATRKQTQVLIVEILMDYNLPIKLRSQAKSFLELLRVWPLRIMVCDMFSVDITLILKFISVSTTYLVIMLQISHFL